MESLPASWIVDLIHLAIVQDCTIAKRPTVVVVMEDSD